MEGLARAKNAGEVRRILRTLGPAGHWKTLVGDDEFRAAAAYPYEHVCAEVSDYARFVEVSRTVTWGRVTVAIDSMARKGMLPSLDDYEGFTIVALLAEYPCVLQDAQCVPHLLDALVHPKVLAHGITPFIAEHVASLCEADLASLAADVFDVGHPLILWAAAHRRAPAGVLDLLELFCRDLDYRPEGEPSTFLMLKAWRLRTTPASLDELLAEDKESFIVAAFWRLVDDRVTFDDVSAMIPELPYLWTFARDCGDTPEPELDASEKAMLDWLIGGI